MKSILKNRRKRFLTPLLILAICLAMAVPMVTADAGTSVKAQAQHPVKRFYKYAKNLDYTKMQKYIATTSGSSSSLTSSEEKQIKKLYSVIKKQNKKRFSYKIVGTTLSSDKKSATIKVRVKYRSLYKAGYYGMTKTFGKIFDYLIDKGKEPSDSKIYEWLVKYIKRGVNKYSAKKVTKTITVNTKKYKNGWKIVSVTDDMTNTYTCDIPKSFDDFTKDLE